MAPEVGGSTPLNRTIPLSRKVTISIAYGERGISAECFAIAHHRYGTHLEHFGQHAVATLAQLNYAGLSVTALPYGTYLKH